MPLPAFDIYYGVTWVEYLVMSDKNDKRERQNECNRNKEL